MPRSFLLKRFSKTSETSLQKEEKNGDEKGQEDVQYDQSEYLKGQQELWNSQPTSLLYVGMRWNQAHITSHHVHRMIYSKLASQDTHAFYPRNHDLFESRPSNSHHQGFYENKSNTTAKEDDKKQAYKCNQCGKVFKTKYTLTIHLKMPSHTGARPFVCAICGKGFRLSSTLCRHKIIHTSHKPHRCQTCGKAFNRSSTLKTHQRTHSDVKEFTCDICGKGFHQKGNLRNHLLIHSGEKPYKCTLCKKAFNKLSNLKFHMHVHTDNKPYRCRFCKESFSRRCELKEHLSICSFNVPENS